MTRFNVTHNDSKWASQFRQYGITAAALSTSKVKQSKVHLNLRNWFEFGAQRNSSSTRHWKNPKKYHCDHSLAQILYNSFFSDDLCWQVSNLRWRDYCVPWNSLAPLVLLVSSLHVITALQLTSIQFSNQRILFQRWMSSVIWFQSI